MVSKNDNCHPISVDPKMQKILVLCNNVAISKATILILGESGTGKEVIAKYIHQLSHRKNNRMVAVNCAAVPEGLIESELFGFEKGAFTGAQTAKSGKFEQAQRSTILLDEISELPFHLQSKLLRVLQEGEVERLGSRSPVKLDVRIIATSNKNLWDLVQKGKFREDLYYRLNVIPIVIPPLRNRLKDICCLADYFVFQKSLKHNLERKTIVENSRKKLLKWHWPGNVRELENVIERAVLLSEKNEIEADNLVFQDEFDLNTDQFIVPGLTVSDVEQRLIINTLEYTEQNRTQAARMLGISIRTLRNKLKEYRATGVL